MKKGSLYVICFLLLSSVISCSDSDTPNPETTLNPLEAYQELNISYGEDSDQVFDLYLPENRTTSTKTIILIHGGGWTSGDKTDMNGFKEYILNQLPNYAVVNINYRLADQDNQPYPMQIDDITTVVNYLKANQSNYVISNNIGFIGASAGAHLSLLWSYAFDVDNQTKMVCSVVGPTKFTDPAYLESNNPVLQELLDTFGIDTTTEYLEEVSPYHRVTVNAPPTILFYGGQDPLIPTTQGTLMHDKLNTLGVTNEFYLYPNEGHGWIGLNLLDTTIKLNAFIVNTM
ncbi:alpha/beta hydrolase fold domain-containing protein [Lacinutrix salivirga]